MPGRDRTERWKPGVRLRRAGVTGNIIVTLGPCLRSLDEIVGFSLQPVVYSKSGLQEMSRLAVQRQKRVDVHLKVDVGMGRLGVMPENARALAETINASPGANIDPTSCGLPCRSDW